MVDLFYAKLHPHFLTVYSHCLYKGFQFFFFFFFAKRLMSSMYIRWLIISCYFVSFYPPVHFLSMRLSGKILIVIAHLPEIFHSGFLPQLNFFFLQSIPVSSFPGWENLTYFMTSSDILYILRQCIIQFWVTMP